MSENMVQAISIEPNRFNQFALLSVVRFKIYFVSIIFFFFFIPIVSQQGVLTGYLFHFNHGHLF